MGAPFTGVLPPGPTGDSTTLCYYFNNALKIIFAIIVFNNLSAAYNLFYNTCRLVFGTLYPAYASYKTVKSKNLKEYVKWMMYWIVFAIFTCVETFTDIFLSWFPFYYEIKIIIVIWLLSPATKGATFLYKKFVHPILSNKEQEIDEYISKAKEQSYKQVLDIGSKGVNVLMQTALKNVIPTHLIPAPSNEQERDEPDVISRELMKKYYPEYDIPVEGETTSSTTARHLGKPLRVLDSEEEQEDFLDLPEVEPMKRKKSSSKTKTKAVRKSNRKATKPKTEIFAEYSDDN